MSHRQLLGLFCNPLHPPHQGDLHLCPAQPGPRLGEVRHDVHEVQDVQHEHGEVAQGACPLVVTKELIGQQHVLAPDVAAHKDLALQGAETALHDEERALVQHLLLGGIDRHGEVPCSPHDDLVVDAAEVPDLGDPALVHEVGILALKLGRHLRNDLLLRSLPVHVARLVEVPAEGLAHLSGHGAVPHQPIEVVHRPLEGHLVRMHGGDDAADSADDVSPDGGHDGGAERGHPVLGDGLGCDVAVADARDADDGPVERDAVDLEAALVELLGALLGRAQSGEPALLRLRVHADGAPEAGHPVADTGHVAEVLQDLQESETKPEHDLPPPQKSQAVYKSRQF
mmetsp:Transcript_76892/g.238755  ORF Transcript_76892/g.238755 Transcript_76892/m.238755 type:complete len:341 (+) Transcript_76892:737-1759(+)